MPAANLAEEWESLRTSIPDDLRGRLAELVGAHTPDLAGLFYETLLRDAEAAPLLSHSLVSERLHGDLCETRVDGFDCRERRCGAPVCLC